MDKILVIGAAGQLGSELTRALADQFGGDQVIATDLRAAASVQFPYCRFEVLDVMDKEALGALVKKERVTQIYHLAAVLSATGEKNPQFAWQLNMDSLLHVLELAKECGLDCCIWPWHTQNQYPTVLRKRPKHGLWNKQTCRRRLVQLLL
jgi:nucleoside-diphosphate-sugar epimerase